MDERIAELESRLRKLRSHPDLFSDDEYLSDLIVEQLTITRKELIELRSKQNEDASR
jgi:hypothetical protein